MAEIEANVGDDAGMRRIAPAGTANPDRDLASALAVPVRGWRYALRLQVLFALAAVLILLLAAAGLVTSREYASYQAWTLHTYQVREQIVQTLYDVHSAELQARDYGLTGRDSFIAGYYRTMAEAEHGIDTLEHLVADNPRQSANAARLRNLIAQHRAELERIIADRRTRDAAAAYADVLALLGKPNHPIEQLATQMRDIETALLAQREAGRNHSADYVAAIAGSTVIGSLLLMLVAFVSVNLEQRRRLRSEERLAQGALELQIALDDARQLADTLRRLSVLGEMLQSCREPDEAIAVIERALPPLLADTSGCVALINPSHNLIEARTQWGPRGADLAAAVFAPDECWALRRSQPHPGFGEVAAPICAHLVHAGVTAGHTLCLPLTAQGQVLGVLTLVTVKPIEPGSREVLLAISDQLALALINLQLQRSLRQQSIRDTLTGLFNRRYLEESLPRELARAERQDSHFALLMLDLDHFKGYNDSHGHDAGDALLAQFGAQLSQMCRGEDIACRFGGEEFTVVLVDIDEANALARAEAIRAATAQIELRHRGQRLPTPSVSIGVAMYPRDGRTPEELKRAADQALYRAKRGGRDRVVAHAMA